LSIFYNNLLIINIQKHAKGFKFLNHGFQHGQNQKNKCSETDNTLFKSEHKQIMMRKTNQILIVDDQEEILFRQNDLEEAF
jgi:hypothetical protein